MPISFPQTDLPRSVSGGSDLWDDTGTAGQLLRSDYLAPPIANIVGANSQQGNIASAAAIVQPHRVTAANSTQTNAVAASSVSQPKFVTAASSVQENHAAPAQVHAQRHYNMRVDTDSRIPGAMVIGEVGADLVSASDSTQANAASAGAIRVVHSLLVANSTQGNSASPASIRGTHLVTVANSTESHIASPGVASPIVIGTAGRSMRVATGSLISGAMVVGNRGLGVLGSEVASAGDDGPGYLYDDLELPADANVEIRGEIITWPSAGTLIPQEDSSFDFTGPVGNYFFTYQPYVAGAPLGTPIEVDLTVYREILSADSVQANVTSPTAIRSQQFVTVANSTGGNACSAGSVSSSAVIQNVYAAGSTQAQIVSDAAILQTHLISISNSINQARCSPVNAGPPGQSQIRLSIDLITGQVFMFI